MVSICFYFQVHQPFRLKQYSVFDIGRNTAYFDDQKNAAVMHKVMRKCYLPANAVLLELLRKHPGFKVSFSLSGVVLEQMQRYAPEVIASFQELAHTGRVEFLAETYYHSLAFLYDREEFMQQVTKHAALIKELFGQTPKVFRNTELIYSNELGRAVEEMGFVAVVAEGWDPVLGWRSPNFVYTAKGTSTKLLLKNYKMSDDIAFRFSNRGWSEWPLSVEKYVSWLNSVNGTGHTVNLFMDYETFGEHQWEDTGIFEFLRALPGEVLKHPHNDFRTVSEVALSYPAMDEVDFPHYVSWADVERDLSAWLGNGMQHAAIDELYRLGKAIRETGDAALIDTWRKLTTSDHFYYMCTKWFADGDVHKYFNPYDSPYEAHIAFMNVLHDLALRAKVQLGRQGRILPAQKAERFITNNPSRHIEGLTGVPTQE